MFDGWTMRADLTMLPRGEIVGVMFPTIVWDAGHWTPLRVHARPQEGGTVQAEDRLGGTERGKVTHLRAI
jgi:hypothetical protein